MWGISDEDLAFVAYALLSRYIQQKLRLYYVEHAFRGWVTEIEFRNDALIPGSGMVDYLVDTGEYVNSRGMSKIRFCSRTMKASTCSGILTGVLQLFITPHVDIPC
ncbi:MAG: hypothetical protein MK110_05375 [Fuerstiella sp.]|nr:hypothetical protein [Fuerstiella sp.]